MADFGKLDFSTSLVPTSAFPLDGRSYFSSKAEADAAAAIAGEVGSTTSKYYYGQKLLVSENSVDTWYVITRENTLMDANPSEHKLVIITREEYDSGNYTAPEGSFVIVVEAVEE